MGRSGSGRVPVVVVAVVVAAALAMLVLPVAAPPHAVAQESGFTVVKKTTGVIMKFCSNEAFTLQDCHERYEGIGWTDRINVLVYAPGWNEDSDKIDVIGTSSSPISVYTSSHRVDNVDFSETGPDTGVFMGVVKMTGTRGYVVHDTYLTKVMTPGMTASPPPISSHDRAVMIGTEPQDGRITVAWEANEDVMVQRSAQYTWQVGEVAFHKPAYDVNEKITFYVRDADLWKHHREFFTNYVRVYSDSDMAGIHVGVQFTKNMEHATVADGFSDRHLTGPAASSLTKYTQDGRWKVYFWWEPGGLLGANQDYAINLMAHDGLTDVHEMGLTYDMEVYLNGVLLETRNDRYSPDGQGIEQRRFDERGSVRIVISNIFDDESQQANFSFQVAPEAVLEEVVPRNDAFEEGNVPDYLAGYDRPHYYNYLPGEFYVTTDDSSDSQNRLRVADGDTIYVEYDDITLPKPYTTADAMEIVARAHVFDTGAQPPDGTEIYVGIT